MPVQKNKKRLLLVPEFVTNLVPRYLPNLRDLKLPKKFVEVDGVVGSMLMPVQAYRHDAEAAERMREELCPIFEVPRSMFPLHAPLNKITFMPPKLLPPGFDAGGVFTSGVLARKFYPLGLLAAGHKGPTPALFVGRRSAPTRNKFNKMLPYMCTEYTGLPVCKLPTWLARGSRDGEDKDALIDVSDKEEKEEEQAVAAAQSDKPEPEDCDVNVGYIIVNANTMDKVCMFANQPVQYKIYVPDLSTVQIMVHSESKYVMTVLSDVVHPHEWDVAKAIKDEQAVTFELPHQHFYDKSLDLPLKRGPVYLPQRFLPANFGAGCVFGPGTLPETFYMRLLRNAPPQMQHNKNILPPIFLGMWKNNCTPTACIFPKKSFLINMSKSPSKAAKQMVMISNLEAARHDINSLIDAKEENDDKDDADEENDDDEELGSMGLFSLTLDPELDEPPFMEKPATNDMPESSANDVTEPVTSVAAEAVQLEQYYGDMLNVSDQNEPARVPALPELPAELSSPRRDPSLWFFELSGHPEEIMNSLHRVSNAGVKLASSYTDQETIKRARAQWMDLIERRAEIREQMIKMPVQRDPRVKTQRRHQPKPGTVCSFCGHVFQ